MKKDEKEYLVRKLQAMSTQEIDNLGGSKPYVVKLWLKEYRAWKNDMELPKSNGRGHGPTLDLPTDKSVIAEVREAMRAYPNDQEAAAKLLNMGNDNFRFIRRLILIEQRSFTTREDREAIQKCFDLIEQKRQVQPAKKMAIEIINRNWAKKKDRPYLTNQRRKRFDQTIMAISESCESTTDMQLPADVSKDDIFKAIGSLTRSMDFINRLMRKLVGEERRNSDG